MKKRKTMSEFTKTLERLAELQAEMNNNNDYSDKISKEYCRKVASIKNEIEFIVTKLIQAEILGIPTPNLYHTGLKSMIQWQLKPSGVFWNGTELVVISEEWEKNKFFDGKHELKTPTKKQSMKK